jgi:hypothetical protein
VKTILLSLCLFSTVLKAEPISGNYELKKSSVKYMVTYLIKHAEGESLESKGKGECKDAACEFLVAAPLKSFNSKDSNRDLNMLNVTKADKFPLVVVRVKTKSDITSGKMIADLDVDFGGVKMTYPGVVFAAKQVTDGFHISGKFDLFPTKHNIEKPSLLGVSIEDNVPLTIEAEWKKSN